MQRTAAAGCHVTLAAGAVDGGQVMVIIIIAGLIMAACTLCCTGDLAVCPALPYRPPRCFATVGTATLYCRRYPATNSSIRSNAASRSSMLVANETRA